MTALKILKQVSKLSEDQLLSHDLINLTHGLLLFLESKKTTGANPNECELIFREVLNLQALVRHHFNDRDERLINDCSIDLFPQQVNSLLFSLTLKKEIDHWASVFFSMPVKTHFHFQGPFDSLFNFDGTMTKHDLSRVIVNLIKNMSEQNVETFSYSIAVIENHPKKQSEKLLRLHFINKVQKFSLRESESRGISSIRVLVENLWNGRYEHFIDSAKNWNTLIDIPIRT